MAPQSTDNGGGIFGDVHADRRTLIEDADLVPDLKFTASVVALVEMYADTGGRGIVIAVDWLSFIEELAARSEEVRAQRAAMAAWRAELHQRELQPQRA